MPAISWDSEKIVAAHERAYVDKPYAAKKKAEAWVTSAATLNARCPLFMAPNPNIMGANLKAKAENAIASYVGTYLSDIANKSGFDGFYVSFANHLPFSILRMSCQGSAYVKRYLLMLFRDGITVLCIVDRLKLFHMNMCSKQQIDLSNSTEEIFKGVRSTLELSVHIPRNHSGESCCNFSANSSRKMLE
jgi:hypothetical protein